MRIVLALDKFKGSLTALQACKAVQRGLRRKWPEATFAIHPVADGGDGTVDALAASIQGTRPNVQVFNPLRSRMVEADFLLAKEVAYLEMASASGLVLLDSHERDPLRADTFGTGQLIQTAIDHGAKHIVVGLGGSATNDGGVGMAQAFGYHFLDSNGSSIESLPANLGELAAINPPPNLPKTTWIALADVTNPLLGPNGATAVYGPQKGVTSDMQARLEEGLAKLADIVNRDLGVNFCGTPGAGAAGGCAFGMMSFFAATLRPGFEYLAEMSGLGDAIATADWVITGEGLLDSQTLNGKAPAGVAAVAKRHGKQIAAIGGGVEPEARGALKTVFQSVTCLTDTVPLDEAFADAERLLEKQAEMLNL